MSVRRIARGIIKRSQMLWNSWWQNHVKRKAINRTSIYPIPYKLHVGCGQVHFPGWINIDTDAATKADLVWDIRQGIPAPDESCMFIYNEHVLEHLTVQEGLMFLRDCRRALKPGGVLRVAMPSLDVLIEKSANGTWRDQDWLTWPGHEYIVTRAEMLNISFRNWEHKWLYDREELHRRLTESGFSDIRDVGSGMSDEPELCNRETRKDSSLICEARG